MQLKDDLISSNDESLDMTTETNTIWNILFDENHYVIVFIKS